MITQGFGGGGSGSLIFFFLPSFPALKKGGGYIFEYTQILNIDLFLQPEVCEANILYWWKDNNDI